MTSETATTYTSPFESGDWGRWNNLERCQWLRAFQQGLKSNEEQIKKQFKLDKKKIKRLDRGSDPAILSKLPIAV